MAEPLLSVKNLSKHFGVREAKVIAVDDVCFDVGAAESVGLVGESGSGKTTTARMIMGLETPSSGTVMLSGHVNKPQKRLKATERRACGKQLQMVFQDPFLSLDRRQAVGSGLAELLKVHYTLSGAELDRRVSELLERVGLNVGKASALPSALSGGERQRVAIARALAPQPKLLILDEAVAALDVSIQAQILNLLAEIRADSGLAYLFVSHDLGVVRHLCDRVLVMRNGQIVEQGPTRAVLAAPEHPYTQLLLNSIPRPGWKPTRTLD